MIDIVIQIVNYNTKKYLPDCIDGVISDLKKVGLSYKILVLDNDSRDDLSDLEKKYDKENVQFYYSDKNGGFGAGHNFLSKKAESEYILILNPDIKFLEAGTITRLIKHFKKDADNKVVIVGPKLLNDSGVQRWDHGESHGFLGRLSCAIGGTFWKDRKNTTEVAWVSGAFFLIKRDIFKEICGFDENFFLYKEEEDLCLRIRKLGFKIIYEPDVKVLHHGSVVASKSEFFNDSDKYFFEKHFRDKGFFVFNFIKILQKIKHKFINKFFYK